MSILDNSSAATTAAGQYLSFSLGTENYGIDILKVQEIRSYEVPTRIPNSRGDLLGVVDLRGVIVPIMMDIEAMLGAEQDALNFQEAVAA